MSVIVKLIVEFSIPNSIGVGNTVKLICGLFASMPMLLFVVKVLLPPAVSTQITFQL